MNKKGIIYGINGPVIYLKGNTGLRMSEMVHVGEEHLVGEVISLSKKATTVQVFEETTGLKPGAEVVGTGDAISVTLGPGILNNIFDGIERPLSEIADLAEPLDGFVIQLDLLPIDVLAAVVVYPLPRRGGGSNRSSCHTAGRRPYRRSGSPQ